MVQVPQANGPSVLPQPLPKIQNTVQPSIENFGGGEQLNRVNNAFQNLISEENNRAFNDRMLEASRALDEFELKTVYDPSTGLLSKKGKDALSTPDDYKKAFDQFSQAQLSQAQDPDARFAMTQMFNARNAHVQGTLANHVSQQMDFYHKSELASGIKSSYAMATVDPSRVPSRLDVVRSNSVELARAEGFEPGSETSNHLIAQNVEGLHDHVLTSMVDQGHYAAARAYLAQYATQMPTNAGKYHEALKISDRLGQTQKIVSDILTPQVSFESDGAGIVPNVKVTQGAQSLNDVITRAARATEGKEPELVKSVQEEAIRQYKIKEQAEAEDHQNLLNGIQGRVESSPGASFDDLVTPTEQVTIASWHGGIDVLNKIHRVVASNQNPVPSQNSANADAAWLNLAEMASKDPASLANMSLLDYRANYWSQFTQSYRDKADTLRKEAVATVGGKTSMGPTISTEKSILDSFRSGMNIYGKQDTPGEFGVENQAKYMDYNHAATIALEEETRRNGGKPLNQKQMDDVLGRVLIYKNNVEKWQNAKKVIPPDSIAIDKIDPTIVSQLFTHMVSLRIPGQGGSESRALPASMTEQEFRLKYQGAIEKAYAAKLNGASMAQIDALLLGAQVAPMDPYWPSEYRAR